MDFKSGQIYRINNSARTIIELGEKGLKVDEAVKKLKPRFKEADVRSFMKELSDQGLIAFSPKSQSPSPVKRSSPKLEFLWIELTSSCNLRCIHCYAEAKAGVEAKPSSSLSTEDVKRIIDEAAALGCRELQFTGGEPTLRGDLRELIEYAKAKGFGIEVFTNGNLLTEPIIRFFAEKGVRVAMSIYSHRAETHDAITKVPGSFERSLNSLKLLLAYEVPLRCAVVAMKQNEAELNETSYFLSRLGVLTRPPDPLRPSGRGRGMENWPKKYGEQSMLTKPSFLVSQENYEKNSCWNSCWFGKAAVTSLGDVLPCVFARDQVVGSIKQQSLKEIVEGEDMLRLWSLTKDNVEVCRDCASLSDWADCGRPWL